MTISGYEIAFFTITFLVPGYIISSVMHLFVPRKVNVHQVEFFRWLALSSAAVGPIFIITFSIIGSDMRAAGSVEQYALDRPVLLSAIWFLSVFLWPLLVSVALGLAGHYHLWRRVQDRSNLFPVGQLNTAWDRRFTETRKGGWILVVLTDDSWIAGEFGKDAHASRDPSERDIFIDQVHGTSLDGRFPNLERQGGILIPSGMIKMIRYWD